MFCIVQKYLTKTKMDFHTVSLPKDKTFKIVIKSLLSLIKEIGVIDKIRSVGFEAFPVIEYGNSIRKFSIHMVKLPANISNKDNFNLPSVFYMSI